MADPLLWGPPCWRAQFQLARRIDVEVAALDSAPSALDIAQRAQLFFTLLSFCFPCDECSMYAIEYTALCPVPLTRLCDYLYDMKSCVDTKIRIVQYGRRALGECQVGHISRTAFYRRLALMSVREGDLRDWCLFWLLAALHSEAHAQRELRMRALNRAMQLFAGFYALPEPGGCASAAEVLVAVQRWHPEAAALMDEARLYFE